MTKQIKGGPNRYLIATERTYNDTVVAPGGTEFFIDSGIDKEWNVRTWGTVRALPCKLSNLETMLVDESTGKLIPSSSLWMDVREGDIAHFRYHVQDNELNRFVVEGESMLWCMADDIVAIERDGELIPQGGKMILIKLEKKIAESDIIKVPDSFKERMKYRYGVIEVGRPLRTDNDMRRYIKKGTVVYLNQEPAPQDFGKGRNYFVAYQRDILAYEA